MGHRLEEKKQEEVVTGHRTSLEVRRQKMRSQ